MSKQSNWYHYKLMRGCWFMYWANLSRTGPASPSVCLHYANIWRVKRIGGGFYWTYEIRNASTHRVVLKAHERWPNRDSATRWARYAILSRM